MTSYTYDEKYNLIFFLAEENTLDNLHKNKSKSSSFKSDEIFYIAFAKFSFEIEHVHKFVEKRINLSLINYHHDLRFKNILIFRNIFILANFDFLRFKNFFESSKTFFKKKNDYLAFECENSLKDFKKQDIHRSSNIWLFDCILSKVTIYMNRDSSAIQMFRDKKKLKIYNFIITYFHCDSNQRNQSVND